MPKRYRVITQTPDGHYSIGKWRLYDFDNMCSLHDTLAELPIEFRFEFN